MAETVLIAVNASTAMMVREVMVMLAAIGCVSQVLQIRN
jgi:hypothetical protein